MKTALRRWMLAGGLALVLSLALSFACSGPTDSPVDGARDGSEVCVPPDGSTPAPDASGDHPDGSSQVPDGGEPDACGTDTDAAVQPDGSIDAPDASTETPDAAVDADASEPGADASVEADASTPGEPDASTDLDASTTGTDASTELDAGSTTADAGSADAGSSGGDAGVPPVLVDLTAADLYNRLGLSSGACPASKGFLLIDVHIPHWSRVPCTDASIAYNDMAALTAYIGSDPTTPVVLTCKAGGMSTTAGTALIAAGYLDVSQLQGGVNAWIAAGYAVDPPAP